MRKAHFFLAVVTMVAIAVPAYAAVENVKMGGDVTVRGLYKDDYSLGGFKDNTTYNGTVFNPSETSQRFFMSQVRLRVNADLTENVEGEIELLNQRDWDSPSGGAQGSGLVAPTNVGLGVAPSGANDQFDVLMNLANIKIKELFYPELTVVIGRQNIQWGEGFVIGNNQLSNPDPSNTISADEFSQFNSFDAIRATVNKDPWHFDAFWTKLQENGISVGDDQTMYGINAGRTFNKYQSEAEIYFIGTLDEGPTGPFGENYTTDEEIWSLGARGSLRPWERLKLSGESVFQWGEEGGAGIPTTGNIAPFTLNGTKRQDIRAFAFDFRAEWAWLESPWPANLGAEWVFYSGEEDSEDGKSGNYRLLRRGKFHSAIREFQGQFYLTDVPATPGFTNEHQVMFDASFNPFNNKDLTFFGRWLMFWLDEIPIAGRGRFLGNELDLVMSYDYTEDLKFRLINAYFMPGNYFGTEAFTLSTAGQPVTQADDTAKLLTAEAVLTF